MLLSPVVKASKAISPTPMLLFAGSPSPKAPGVSLPMSIEPAKLFPAFLASVRSSIAMVADPLFDVHERFPPPSVFRT